MRDDTASPVVVIDCSATESAFTVLHFIYSEILTMLHFWLIPQI